jgi:multicomponent Na+:H+ antiporter subunit F
MVAQSVVLPLLALACVLAVVRLLRGPHLADRVVALDLLTAAAAGVAATYAVATDQTVYLDVAVLLALVSFVGTVAFARYVERAR